MSNFCSNVNHAKSMGIFPKTSPKQPQNLPSFNSISNGNNQKKKRQAMKQGPIAKPGNNPTLSSPRPSAFVSQGKNPLVSKNQIESLSNMEVKAEQNTNPRPHVFDESNHDLGDGGDGEVPPLRIIESSLDSSVALKDGDHSKFSEEESRQESAPNAPQKKVGCKSNQQRREVATNMEKELGKHNTLDGMFRKELRASRNQGGPNPPEGGIPKSTSK
jgi:hypothetical protein